MLVSRLSDGTVAPMLASFNIAAESEREFSLDNEHSRLTGSKLTDLQWNANSESHLR